MCPMLLISELNQGSYQSYRTAKFHFDSLVLLPVFNPPPGSTLRALKSNSSASGESRRCTSCENRRPTASLHLLVYSGRRYIKFRFTAAENVRVATGTDALPGGFSSPFFIRTCVCVRGTLRPERWAFNSLMREFRGVERHRRKRGGLYRGFVSGGLKIEGMFRKCGDCVAVVERARASKFKFRILILKRPRDPFCKRNVFYGLHLCNLR